MQMEEIADAHPKNCIDLIAPEFSAEPYSKCGVASGVPRDTLPDGDNPPYMISISKLEECTPQLYEPVYKMIQHHVKSRADTMEVWLNRMNLVIKSWENKGNARTATHVAMNNGRFFISEEHEAEFLRWYAVTVSLHKKIWFVEQLTPVFRYFVDLDFCHLAGLHERCIHATAKVVQRAVRKFYPCVNTDDCVEIVKPAGKATEKAADVLRTIVCTTNYKFISPKDGKPEMVKTGVHMLWPNIYLTRDDALNIRETIVVDLETEFGKRVFPLNPWHDVVDVSVYGSGNSGTKGSGLRMLGSRKTDACYVCKGRRKVKADGDKTCDKCLGWGKLDTGRAYFALCVLDSYGERDLAAEAAYHKDMHLLMVDSKVRSYFTERPAAPAVVVPEHAPRHLLSNKRGRATLAERDAGAGVKRPLDPSLRSANKCELRNSAPEWDLLLNIVRGLGDGVYKSVTLAKVTLDAKKTQYVVHISGENCRFCHNIKREHASNRIYFVVDAAGIAQRCHDSATVATEEMQYGLCKDYAGLLGRIPQPLVAQLFPQCAAAKTLTTAPAAEDEFDDDADAGMRRICNDRKLRKLYQMGDALCHELYKQSWSDTLRTSNGEHVISRQRDMVRSSKRAALAVGDRRYVEEYALDPAALGSRGNQAMRDLGFLQEDAPRDDCCEDARKRVVPLTKLSAQLFRDLEFGVELAASLSPESFPPAEDMGGFDALLSYKLIMEVRK